MLLGSALDRAESDCDGIKLHSQPVRLLVPQEVGHRKRPHELEDTIFFLCTSILDLRFCECIEGTFTGVMGRLPGHMTSFPWLLASMPIATECALPESRGNKAMASEATLSNQQGTGPGG